MQTKLHNNLNYIVVNQELRDQKIAVHVARYPPSPSRFCSLLVLILAVHHLSITCYVSCPFILVG